jgi:hypothetical protein
MLKDKTATTVPEWVVVLGVVILIGAVVLVTLLNGATTEGSSVAGWIEGLGVPSVP